MDRVLTMFGLQGVYYMLHAIHNAAIVHVTAVDVLMTLCAFEHISTFPTNYLAIQLCVALHVYHVLLYWRKFRADDWLHHTLMVGVALPIGGLLPSGTLLGYSLFFTTGLPGCIDYLLLFCTRNGYLERDVEKRVNAALNVWVRSPGCVSQAALTLAYLSMHTAASSPWFIAGALCTAALNYWNGQYFMEQVVSDYARRDALTLRTRVDT